MYIGRTKEEAAHNMELALNMEVEGCEEGEGTLMALVDTGFLTQEADSGGTTIVDACNSFNELSRLEMMWTVRHLWPTGARFAFNFYKHWA